MKRLLSLFVVVQFKLLSFPTKNWFSMINVDIFGFNWWRFNSSLELILYLPDL